MTKLREQMIQDMVLQGPPTLRRSMETEINLSVVKKRPLEAPIRPLRG